MFGGVSDRQVYCVLSLKAEDNTHKIGTYSIRVYNAQCTIWWVLELDELNERQPERKHAHCGKIVSKMVYHIPLGLDLGIELKWERIWMILGKNCEIADIFYMYNSKRNETNQKKGKIRMWRQKCRKKTRVDKTKNTTIYRSEKKRRTLCTFYSFYLNSAVGIVEHGSLLQIFNHFFIGFHFDEAIDAYVLPLSSTK